MEGTEEPKQVARRPGSCTGDDWGLEESVIVRGIVGGLLGALLGVLLGALLGFGLWCPEWLSEGLWRVILSSSRLCWPNASQMASGRSF